MIKLIIEGNHYTCTSNEFFEAIPDSERESKLKSLLDKKLTWSYNEYIFIIRFMKGGEENAGI